MEPQANQTFKIDLGSMIGAKKAPVAVNERKILYCVAYLDKNGHEKFAYLHGKDIADARLQCMLSRKVIEKGAYFLGVARVVGWVEEEPKKIISFGGI